MKNGNFYRARQITCPKGHQIDFQTVPRNRTTSSEKSKKLEVLSMYKPKFFSRVAFLEKNPDL